MEKITLTNYSYKTFKIIQYLDYTNNRRGASYESIFSNNLISRFSTYIEGSYPGEQKVIARIWSENINSDSLYLYFFVWIVRPNVGAYN